MNGIVWHYMCVNCNKTFVLEIYTPSYRCPDCNGWITPNELIKFKEKNDEESNE